MLEKYIITQTSSMQKFALKYYTEDGTLQIGGRGEFARMIQKFIDKFFEYELPENCHSQRARVRYDFGDVPESEFRDFQDEIDEDEDWNMEMTKSLNDGKVGSERLL